MWPLDVRRPDRFKRAKSYEVFDKLTPHFATIGLSRQEAIQVKVEFLAWQARYDDCRERYLCGEHVIWPRRHLGHGSVLRPNRRADLARAFCSPGSGFVHQREAFFRPSFKGSDERPM